MRGPARALAGALIGLAACGPAPEVADDDGWIPLFDGRTLEGWTPKIRGHAPGEDPYGTFRVDSGLLMVSYEGYDAFDDRFGHLFHEVAYDSYDLRVEYRFVGEQAPGGPGWALRNSGVMVHSQGPGTLGIEQDFPISLEAQLLGGDGSGPRPTANLCTPGTRVEMDGRLVEAHCVESSSATFDGDVWVTVDLVVRGDSLLAHLVEGDTVLRYHRPTVGGGAVSGFVPAEKRDGRPLRSGWIALQSESHPVQFRKVWLRPRPAR